MGVTPHKLFVLRNLHDSDLLAKRIVHNVSDADLLLYRQGCLQTHWHILGRDWGLYSCGSELLILQAWHQQMNLTWFWISTDDHALFCYLISSGTRKKLQTLLLKRSLRHALMVGWHVYHVLLCTESSGDRFPITSAHFWSMINASKF